MSRTNTNRPKVEERIQKVLDLLAMSYMTYQIENECSKEWGVSKRQVRRYLTKVYAFLKESLNEKNKDKILLEYETLIKRHEKKGEIQYAYLYRKQRDKILGLEVSKSEVTIREEQPLFIRKKDEDK